MELESMGENNEQPQDSDPRLLGLIPHSTQLVPENINSESQISNVELQRYLAQQSLPPLNIYGNVGNVHLHINQRNECYSVSGEDSDESSDDETAEATCVCETRKPVERGKTEKLYNFVYNLAFKVIKRDSTLGFSEKLKDFYKNVTLSRVWWLDEEHNKSIKDFYAKLDLKCNDLLIPLEEIMGNENFFFKRILIEGQPGYGKTTLANKIAYDWATDADYLKKFKLCLLQPLRYLGKKSVEEGIECIAENCEYEDVAESMTIVKENANCTLLILDGLDELSIPGREHIIKVLFKKDIYKEMTVIATSRTGLFSLEREEMKKLYGGVAKSFCFYDTRIIIEGIALNERKKFLEKFVAKETIEKVKNQLDKLTEPVAEMFRSPLFLVLLAIMLEDQKKLCDTTTKTSLYRELINFVIRRSSERNEIYLEKDFNLFINSRESRPFQIKFHEFGRLCLKKILVNSTQFLCKELTNEIYKFGFLVNHRIVSNFESSKHFEPFHFSFMEFAAAYFLSRDYQNNSSKFSNKLLTEIRAVILNSGGTSLVPEFLTGLLSDDLCNFFTQLLPIAHVFSSSKTAFWNIAGECRSLTKSCNFIDPFFPKFGNSSTYFRRTIKMSSTCADVMTLGIEKNQILPVCIENTSPWTLPQLKTVRILKIYVFRPKRGDVLKEEYFDVIKKIRCHDLHLHLKSYYNVSSCFDLFDSIEANNKTLYLDRHVSFASCINCIKESNLQNGNLDLCVAYSCVMVYHFLEILLNRKQIKRLKVYIIDGDLEVQLITDLVKLIANSDCLESIWLEKLRNFGVSVEIDIGEFFRNGAKQMQEIVLNKIKLICNEVTDNLTHIPFLRIIDIGNHVETITSLNMLSCTTFQCSATLLEKIFSEDISWPSIGLIQELTIVLNSSSSCDVLWEKLKCFTKLKILQIVTTSHVKTLPSQECLVRCFRSLSISNLRIIVDERGEYFNFKAALKFVTNLFNGGENLSLINWTPITLVNVDLVCGITRDLESEEFTIFCESVFQMFECVKNNRIKEGSVVFYNVETLFSLLQRKFIDISVFHVEHVVWEKYAPVFFVNDPVAHLLKIKLRE